MGLSNKKEEQLRQMPLIKTRVSKSKDGRYLIHRTELIHIRPTAYYSAVLSNNESVAEEQDEDLQKLVDAN